MPFDVKKHACAIIKETTLVSNKKLGLRSERAKKNIMK